MRSAINVRSSANGDSLADSPVADCLFTLRALIAGEILVFMATKRGCLACLAMPSILVSGHGRGRGRRRRLALAVQMTLLFAAPLPLRCTHTKLLTRGLPPISAQETTGEAFCSGISDKKEQPC